MQNYKPIVSVVGVVVTIGILVVAIMFEAGRTMDRRAGSAPPAAAERDWHTHATSLGNADDASATEEAADDGSFDDLPEGVLELVIDSDDQMRFDTERFAVRAGQTVKLTLNHSGQLPVNVMGHNLVILAIDEEPVPFGNEVSQRGGSLENDYVPEAMRDRVIAYTAMIGGGESDTVEFVAPEEPGEYPFICSFPGHYTMMRGVMVVRADVETDRVDEETEPAPAGGIQLVRMEELAPYTDPYDAMWEQVPTANVEVHAQNMISPMLNEGSIDELQVQGMTDGNAVVWRVSWEVAEPSDAVDTNRFSDAVALQVPLAENASFMMGSPGQPVHVVYWRALWQQDVDEGMADVSDLYPNVWSDLYWHAEGPSPFPVSEAFSAPESREWFSANQAGNPMSQFDRAQPVEELVAEGVGSVTSIQESRAQATGTWQDDRWSVVIVLPFDERAELAEQFTSGSSTSLAVAVWDGSAGNVGGRKHYSIWVPVEVE